MPVSAQGQQAACVADDSSLAGESSNAAQVTVLEETELQPMRYCPITSIRKLQGGYCMYV